MAGGQNNIDYGSITVSDATVKTLASITGGIPTGAKGALMTIDQKALRMRDDGTDPAADEGHLLNVGDVLTFDSWSVPKAQWKSVFPRMKFIPAVAGTTGYVRISWYD